MIELKINQQIDVNGLGLPLEWFRASAKTVIRLEK